MQKLDKEVKMPRGTYFEAQVKQLIDGQLKEWALAAKNYSVIKDIVIKKIQFDGFHFFLQFNPERIKSSSAKIDKESIQKRACFLCQENRPVEQKSLDFIDQYSILINPYPIFPQHLTIVHRNHLPQLIKPHFANMLDLAKELPDYTIFYNGPKCGASAPDHFHFQAGTKGYMPLDNQISNYKKKYGFVQKSAKCEVWKIDDGIRKFFLVESDDKQTIQDVFLKIHETLLLHSSLNEEPALNIHCSYTDSTWNLVVFPRGKHRPWQFDAPENKNFLFSPASVDLGGLITLSRENDFKKIKKEDLVDMMEQIGPDEKLFDNINLKA